jgi:hypothetical protein
LKAHNKSFKFVPALRTSTGRVLRTRRLTKMLYNGDHRQSKGEEHVAARINYWGVVFIVDGVSVYSSGNERIS